MTLPIVNENDEIIAHKHKSNLTPLDIYRVSRLVIVNQQGQLLMAQRALTKQKDPGVWGLAVEGTVENDETYESNIRKEAEEEIGIILGNIQTGPKFRRPGKYNHYCQVFIYHTELDVTTLQLQRDEVAQVAWYGTPTLQKEIASNPSKFGYNFNLIFTTILPYIA